MSDQIATSLPLLGERAGVRGRTNVRSVHGAFRALSCAPRSPHGAAARPLPKER